METVTSLPSPDLILGRKPATQICKNQEVIYPTAGSIFGQNLNLQ